MTDPKTAIDAVITAYKAYTQPKQGELSQKIANQQKQQEAARLEAERLKKEREGVKPYKPK